MNNDTMPVYFVVWEYDRSNFMYQQYGIKKILKVIKADFMDREEVYRSVMNTPDRPIQIDMFSREPENIFRESTESEGDVWSM